MRIYYDTANRAVDCVAICTSGDELHIGRATQFQLYIGDCLPVEVVQCLSDVYLKCYSNTASSHFE